MNLPAFFIRHPIATTIIMLAIIFFGIVGYNALPVSDLPNVDFPTIEVSASLPGANPQTMATSIATPLERQFSTIAGLDSMSSTNSLGKTQVTLQFKLDRNIDAAGQDVQAAIAQASKQMPQGMPSPPTYRKVNPADMPVILIALSSPTLLLYQVDEYAETFLSQEISMLSGVAQVQVFGPQKFAVRVQVDPRALAAYKIGLNDVGQAIQKANVNLPVGTLDGSMMSYQIESNGILSSASEYLPIVVAYRNGSPVRIRDIGEAINSVENDKISGWYKTTRAIVLAVQRQPGSNTVAVVDEVKKVLSSFQQTLPASATMNVLVDRSRGIRNSVRDVKFTLLVTVCLVILVIFLFLRNSTATIIPSLALPVSIIGTFATMYLLGFNVDNLSLMALVLSVGFVVDDAIVMLENIMRHIEEGEDPHSAAFRGSGEIGFTIISMTAALIAVFIPLLFMRGLMGRLLHEFAVTIAVAILISGFVSLSLTPMLCHRFLKPRTEKKGLFYNVLERGFQGLHNLYRRSLDFILRFRFVTLILAILSFFVALYLFAIVPKGFLPSEDLDQIYCFCEGDQGTSFDNMKEMQMKVADIIMADENVEAFMNTVSGRNSGRLIILLKPRSKRKLSADKVIEELRPKISHIPGLRAYLQNPPPIRIGGMMTKAQYQFALQGTNTEDLYTYAPILEKKMQEIPEIADVNTDLQIKNPEINIEIDRDKASTLGITADQIQSTCSSAFGNRQISTIYTSTNQYQVILELKKEFQLDPSVLSLLYVSSSSGQLVPLSAVAHISRGYGPLYVNHIGQLPAVTLSFNLKPGASLGDAVKDIEKLAHEILPSTVNTSFKGSAQVFQESLQGSGFLLIIAVLVIYMVLGILYESFIHPLTIISGLPSAAIGALLTLMLFHRDLDVYGLVGVILLIGIVKKNAIMMIDFALKQEREAGKPPEEAIYQGCLIRFRPIMMTTMAALMGAIPIAMGLGAGGDARRSLGLAVVGGLAISQFITLYITPVIYVYLKDAHNWLKRGREKKIALQTGQ